MGVGLCCTFASYMVRRNGILHFRMVVPTDIRQSVGRRELRMSLKTGYVREGGRKAARMAGIAQDAFDEIRKGKRGTMAELDAQQIRTLVGEWLRECLEDDERDRASRKRPLSREELEDETDIHERLLSDAREYLATADYRHAVPSAEFILEDNGLEVDRTHASFNVLCREVLKAQIAGLEVAIRRDNGDYDNPYTSLAMPVKAPLLTAQTEVSAPEATDCGPLLSELLKKFTEEKMELGHWTTHTLKDNVPMVEDFIEMVGDIPIGLLTAAHMRDARDRFKKVPKQRRLKKQYKGKSLRKLSDMPIPERDRFSITTLNNRADKIGGYLKWVKDQGYPVEDGLASILTFKKPKNSSQGRTDERAPFAPEDLQRIFHPDNYLKYIYVKGEGESPARFWVPIIGLCTGMRLEEICQLYIDDIREVKGVWCIDINARKDKSRKTTASERLVPVPPVVKDLGFLEYVESLKTRGEERVFPDLDKDNSTEKYSHKIGKAFNYYLHKQLCITQDEKGRGKVFHSLRHTFANRCKQLGLKIRQTKQTIGHKQGSDITLDYYADEYEPDIIYREVTCKATPQVDLSPLRETAQNFIKK